MNLLYFIYYLGYLRHALLPILTLLLLILLSTLQSFIFLLVTPAIFDRLFISLEGFILFKIASILIVSLALQVGLKIGIGIVSSHINHKVAAQLRIGLLKQAFGKEQRFFDRASKGDLSKRLIIDTESTAQGIQYACLFGFHLLQFMVTAYLFFRMEHWFFEIYMCLAALHVLWSQPWKMAMAWTAKKISQDYSKCYGFMWQVAGNLRLIKLLNLNRKMETDFAALQAKVKSHFDWNESFNAISFAAALPLVFAGYGLVAFHCIRRMEEGVYSLGSVAAFTGILFTIMDCVYSGMEAFGTVLRSAAFARQIADVRNQKNETSGKEKIAHFNQCIEFRSMHFSYSSEREILKGLNFTIPKGSNFGIVGKSGCGKSTVLNLLLKLYDGYQGEILIDGRPIRKLNTESVRAMTAYFGQENFVFLGSLLDNIDPSGMMEEGKVMEISNQVGLREVIDKLPEGIHTRVNSDGSPLSGGQIQRLFLARVMARNAPILILDEATSNLDPRTEKKMLEVLAEFAKEKTVITVSHRLEVIKKCDMILVLQDGRQVQIGTYPELLLDENGQFLRIFGLTEKKPDGREVQKIHAESASGA